MKTFIACFLFVARAFAETSALYPDPKKTPGDADPAVTQENIRETICVPGYTKTVRAVGAAAKRKVFLEYGEDPARSREFEVDHFISLQLGGSNDVKNLWPEPYCPLPRQRDCYGAREKDVVEGWLHRRICKGELSLGEAQALIVKDWFALYKAIPKKTGKAVARARRRAASADTPSRAPR